MVEQKGAPRLCVVTPYHREAREVVERCLASVRAQTVRADHIVVADGFPQAWIDEAGVRHFKLDREHDDYGNTPRGLGAMMAIGERYDAIAFLDADNAYTPDHLEACLATAAAQPRAPYVVAHRDFVRPDGSIMALGWSEDAPLGDHVDTNCCFLLPPTYPLLHHWCTMPRELAILDDRLFRAVLASRLPAPAFVSSRRTVRYTCWYSGFYRALGEPPPRGAKPDPDTWPCLSWLRTLAPRDMALVEQLSGLKRAELIALCGSVGRMKPLPASEA